MKLYEYVVIYVPKDKEKNKPKIAVDVTRILAADERTATMIASRAIPEEYMDKLDEVEVAVRPF